jgi:hypothetical protein
MRNRQVGPWQAHGALRTATTSSPPGLAMGGDIDEETYSALIEVLFKLAGNTAGVHIDLSAVKFCDVAGLHSIIQTDWRRPACHSARGPCAAAYRDENPRLGRHARAGDQPAPALLPGDAAGPAGLAGALLVRRSHPSAMPQHTSPRAQGGPLTWARSMKHRRACPAAASPHGRIPIRRPEDARGRQRAA